MENCLVTRLKAVVNNDSLPVLETMQQFTLDAIARSGNNTLTDEQKVALNHFFYQIGAVSNNELWQSVDMLLLPIIGATKEGVCQDYKTTGAYLNNSSYIVDQAGSLEVTFGGTNNSTGIRFTPQKSVFKYRPTSFLYAGVKDSNIPSSRIGFATTISSNYDCTKLLDMAANNYCRLNILRESKGGNLLLTDKFPTDSNGNIAYYSINGNAVNFVVKDSNGITQIPAELTALQKTLDLSDIQSYVSLFITNGIKIEVLISFNAALSDTDRNKVISAVSDLKQALA